MNHRGEIPSILVFDPAKVRNERREKIANQRACAENTEKGADARRRLEEVEPTGFASDRDDNPEIVDPRVDTMQLRIVRQEEMLGNEKVRAGLVGIVVVGFDV